MAKKVNAVHDRKTPEQPVHHIPPHTGSSRQKAQGHQPSLQTHQTLTLSIHGNNRNMEKMISKNHEELLLLSIILFYCSLRN